MASRMKQCWRDWGLTEEGARHADDAIDQMVAIVERTGGEVARTVLEEARFRVERLPKRTPAFQRSYLRKNGNRKSSK